jgi:hypothetical protein
MPICPTITLLSTSSQVAGFVALKAEIKLYVSHAATLTFEPTDNIGLLGLEILDTEAPPSKPDAYLNVSWIDNADDLTYPLVKRVNVQAHLPFDEIKEGKSDPTTSRWTVCLTKIASVCKDLFPNFEFEQSTFWFHLQSNRTYSFKESFDPRLIEQGRFVFSSVTPSF